MFGRMLKYIYDLIKIPTVQFHLNHVLRPEKKKEKN